MQTHLKTGLLATALMIAPAALAGEPAEQRAPAPTQVAVQPAAPVFTQGSANVYRRFPPSQTAKMVEFYDKVLALRPLQPIQLNANTQMILFGVGGGQIKLAAGLKDDRKYHGGGVNDATGIRLFTLHFPDEAALVARFKAAGYPAPVFKDMGGGKRGALVMDPGGFALQLVVGATPVPTGVDVGVNVTDLERSRAFYRNFVGLQELPPVKDPVLGVTKYPFKRGETTVSLYSVGKNLPADTGSGGIQYVIRNVEAMNERALAEKVTVETPLGGVRGFNLITVWLNDPDGVTNYFYQTTGAPRAPAQRTAPGGAPAPAPVSN
jgi:catechol 2,3-dioxygenase-like lactoylglutathione lyase family enzyme